MKKALLLLLAACAPELPGDPSFIGAPRILAVIAEPAEVTPGATARYTAWAAGPDGPITDLTQQWSFCTTPRPLGEDGSIAPSCLSGGSARTSSLSFGAVIPQDACRIFGPDPTGGNFRATDPDPSGGYYQPIILTGLDPPTVASQRISCGLPRVSVDVAREFQAEYRANENPRILSLEIENDELIVTVDPLSIETHPLALPGAEEITTRTEVLTASWFTTDGHMIPAKNVLHEGRASARQESNSGTAWVVVRDDRGGAAVIVLQR